MAQDFQIHLMGAGASSQGNDQDLKHITMSTPQPRPQRLTYIPPDSDCRGVAACFPQPVNQVIAVLLRNLVKGDNARQLEYRGSDGDIDILRHVFRWDRAPYDVVFENGLFISRGLSDKPSFNLEHYVNSGLRRLDSGQEKKHGFISTTLNSAWFPNYVKPGSSDILHRYEIYAPGGILVAQTLGDIYHYTDDQDEVTFVYGIAPQYIRSAQVFTLSNNRGSPGCQRLDNNIYINTKFNPQSSPQRLLKIQNPVGAYVNLNRQLSNLDPIPYPRMGDGSTHGAHNDPQDDAILEHYKVGVTDVESYIDAAFRCRLLNQAFIFIKTEYVTINYATDGPKLHGPAYIGAGFQCLAGTVFAEYGIDAAFAFLDDTTEAMIFSGNLCARIDYAPVCDGNPCFTKEPKPIREMFPCLKGTKFAEGIDCAFATKGRNAYLFKGKEYALIDHVNGILVAARPIKDGFVGLHGCGFASDLDAALATHEGNVVYLFKGKKYLKLHYTPGRMDDKIVTRPRDIVPQDRIKPQKWRSLSGLLPRKNIAVDQLPVPRGTEVSDNRLLRYF